jgi:hypothetical protein
VRGQPAFVLSMLLRWLAPALRETAGVSSWQVPDAHPNRSALGLPVGQQQQQQQQAAAPACLGSLRSKSNGGIEARFHLSAVDGSMYHTSALAGTPVRCPQSAMRLATAHSADCKLLG